MLRISGIILLLFSFLSSLFTSSNDETSPPLSPEDELKSMRLAPGFKMELVAAEPMVQDPVFSQFDEKGRLWVIEMRGYMPDIDGTGEDEPIGRISVLEDTNGDYKMDKSTVFADDLVMPRAICFFPDGVLVSENIPLLFIQDTNGDGKADKRTLVDSTYGGGGLPEHSANGLLLGMDNWIYSAKSKYRYKRKGDNWIKEETEFRGQWGISMDNDGRMYYNYNWSQLHADLVPPNYLNRNPHFEANTGIDHGLTIDRRVYPVRPNPAINRGYIPGTLDKEGKLLEFTSACSPYVAREKHWYPASFYSSVFVCEPAGNLVKQNFVRENGSYLEAMNAYEGREFLASEDERFRPASITSGPDGALYLTDMYRGISQHGAYMTEYLRKQTLERGLDKHIHLGRIWRIIPENVNPEKFTDLSLQSPEQWASNLSSSSSWKREQSLRLLLQTKPQKAVPELIKTVKSGSTEAGISAIWALNTLNSFDVSLASQVLSGSNDKMKSLALRLLETEIKQNKTSTSIQNILDSYLKNPSSAVFNLQILLSSNAFPEEFAFHCLDKLLLKHGNDGLYRDAALSALSNLESGFLTYLLNKDEWREKDDAKEIILDQLSAIIVKRRNEDEIAKLISVLETNSSWQKEALLAGASLQTATSDLPPLAINEKPALFSNLTSPALVRFADGFTWPGKPVKQSEGQEKKTMDAATMKQFAAGKQSYLTYCAGCHGTNGRGMKRFAPPLAGSEWVTGAEDRLALILLHGIEGPIDVNSQRYDVPDILPVMPSHSTLDDGDIANILTYIRNEWGNNAGAVSRRTVGMLRISSQGKVVPWTAPELNEHAEKLKQKK